MKLNIGRTTPGKARRDGFAVLVSLLVLAVLAWLLVLNGRTLTRVKQEILLLEKKHEQRLTTAPAEPGPPPP